MLICFLSRVECNQKVAIMTPAGGANPIGMFATLRPRPRSCFVSTCAVHSAATHTSSCRLHVSKTAHCAMSPDTLAARYNLHVLINSAPNLLCYLDSSHQPHPRSAFQHVFAHEVLPWGVSSPVSIATGIHVAISLFMRHEANHTYTYSLFYRLESCATWEQNCRAESILSFSSSSSPSAITVS